jgi:hypothetical protein
MPVTTKAKQVSYPIDDSGWFRVPTKENEFGS